MSGYTTKTGFAFGGVLEQVLKVTDLLLQGGGFGMVVLDLGDIPTESLRRVPLTSWFRFRRTVEPTATVLLLIEQEPCAKTCASLVLQLQSEKVLASDSLSVSETAQAEWEFSHSPDKCARVLHLSTLPRAEFFPAEKSGEGRSAPADDIPCIPKNNLVSHATLLRGMRFRADVVRSWSQRKPPQSSGVNFELRTAL
jgi:hypothetical protein